MEYKYCGSKFRLSPTVTSCRLHFFQSKTFCTPPTAVLKPSLASPKNLTTIKIKNNGICFNMSSTVFMLKHCYCSSISHHFRQPMLKRWLPNNRLSNLFPTSPFAICRVQILTISKAFKCICMHWCHSATWQEQAFLWRHISFCLELHLCVWLARLCLTLTISFLPHEKSSVFHSGFYICQSC